MGAGAEVGPLSGEVHAVVFDASDAAEPKALAALYECFHEGVGALGRCGRLIVLGRPEASAANPTQAATRAALRGFVKSVAKEVGRRGATAHLVFVADGAEANAVGLLRFLLSPRSAFVSGQVFDVGNTLPVGPHIFTGSLKKKVALVTGAARGIGAATARRLADEGAHVVCADRPDSEEPLAALARDINGSVLPLDVTDVDAPDILRKRLLEHGGVHCVVHNAGVTRDRTLKRMTREEWDMAMDVNLGAVARLTDALWDDVLQENARVVCVSSVVGIAGNLGQSNYAASKAGIIGLCRSFSQRGAERGIAVSAVAPGFIETRMVAKIPPFLREVGRRLSALGQGGDPLDVAETITFLCTPQAAGITGSVVRVCGGAFIGA